MTLSQPLNQSSWDFLGSESSRLTSLYPLSSFSDINAPYTAWEDESFAIAQQYVYAGISEGTVPSEAYLTQGKKVAE